jgi:hypothetical protein
MAITNSNIFTEPYSVMESFIKNNVTDPRRRYKKKWIYPSMPRMAGKGFDGFPFVVLSLSDSEENKTFDSSKSEKIFNILMSIYSDQASEVDTISNSIYANKASLTDFYSTTLGSSNFNWNLNDEGKKVHWRDVGIIARKRI